MEEQSHEQQTVGIEEYWDKLSEYSAKLRHTSGVRYLSKEEITAYERELYERDHRQQCP